MKTGILLALSLLWVSPSSIAYGFQEKPAAEGGVMAEKMATVQKNRSFEFVYSGTISPTKAGQKIKAWIPIPPSTDDQTVGILSKKLPKNAKVTQEKKFGNRVFFFEMTSQSNQKIPFSITYRISRKEVKGLVGGKLKPSSTSVSPNFLKANKLVPTEGKPIQLFDDFSNKSKPGSGSTTVGKAQQFYEFVYQHLKYDKSQPGYGNGDVLWACDSRTGNCTDFHSLFISVARNKKIPAKFQIGFPLPTARGEGEIKGYHCWARFYSDKFGWIPVDISEADKHPELKKYYFGNLTENRVLFSTGRDLQLQPKNESGPVNYLVYPLVEFDGKVVPKKDLNMNFRYKDIRPQDVK